MSYKRESNKKRCKFDGKDNNDDNNNDCKKHNYKYISNDNHDDNHNDSNYKNIDDSRSGQTYSKPQLMKLI